MKTLLTTGMVTALLIGGVASANAQMEQLDRPFRVNVGLLWPSDGDVTDFVGNSHFKLGLSYDMWGGMFSGRAYRGGVFFDLSTKERGGNSFNTSAIGAFGRFNFGEGGMQGWTPYAGAGLGMFFIDADQDAPPPTGARTSLSVFQGGSRLGGKLFVGLEATQGYFAELGYQWTGSKDGANASGLSVSVGFRF